MDDRAGNGCAANVFLFPAQVARKKGFYMYCDPALKLNKFRFVRIPRPADYVQRFGLHDVNGSYSSEPLPRDNRKVSVMSRLVSFNASDVRSAELRAQQEAAARVADEAASAGV